EKFCLTIEYVNRRAIDQYSRDGEIASARKHLNFPTVEGHLIALSFRQLSVNDDVNARARGGNLGVRVQPLNNGPRPVRDFSSQWIAAVVDVDAGVWIGVGEDETYARQ